MKGMQMIRAERHEQIQKHKWDDSKNTWRELSGAAKFAKDPVKYESSWPVNWHFHFKDKIANKPEVERLAVSGALYLAVCDKRGDKLFYKEVKLMAQKMNRLLKSNPTTNNTIN